MKISRIMSQTTAKSKCTFVNYQKVVTSEPKKGLSMRIGKGKYIVEYPVAHLTNLISYESVEG